jgi:hypothetical protein
MMRGVVYSLALLLTGCASAPAPTQADNSSGYVWVATPLPSGQDAERAAHLQNAIETALAHRGYTEDPSGALAVAVSFSGVEDPSIGAYQGGYAAVIETACAAPMRSEPITGCVSIFQRASGRLVTASSAPLAWDADDQSVDHALTSALPAHEFGN